MSAGLPCKFMPFLNLETVEVLIDLRISTEPERMSLLIWASSWLDQYDSVRFKRKREAHEQ
jgi:hypothetical protein